MEFETPQLTGELHIFINQDCKILFTELNKNRIQRHQPAGIAIKINNQETQYQFVENLNRGLKKIMLKYGHLPIFFRLVGPSELVKLKNIDEYQLEYLRRL